MFDAITLLTRARLIYVLFSNTYYFDRSCPRTATLYCWRGFCSFQLELARPNYINGTVETFKRFLVMQKKTLVKFEHCKIIFVKVESSVIEISENFHWSRRCYAISFISVWNEMLLGSQGTVNQTISCQHTLSKIISAPYWRGTVVLESK